jgi:hypothetical protein
MTLSERTHNKATWLFHFCHLYNAHRDFILAKIIVKSKPLKYEQAESLSNFCNQIVATKKAKPQDFIIDEDDKSNDVISSYVVLKDCLKIIKSSLGTKEKDKLYKAVKVFYRKRMYCYQMDSFFTWLINGFYLYINNFISFEHFKNNYCFEISIFDGKKKPIQLRQVIKISQYILINK